jgi:hypothetical protein
MGLARADRRDTEARQAWRGMMRSDAEGRGTVRQARNGGCRLAGSVWVG